MQHFEFRVQGLRASPVVLLVMTRDAETARAMAERMRRGSEGGAHIDVWRAKRYLFTVGEPTPRDEHAVPDGYATAF